MAAKLTNQVSYEDVSEIADSIGLKENYFTIYE